MRQKPTDSNNRKTTLQRCSSNRRPIENFADLNLDAVFVLTPIPSHYPIIKQIYDQKVAKNVFVEKTLTSSYSRSEELQAIAQQGWR